MGQKKGPEEGLSQAPQVLLGSWCLSQEGEWETEMRYLQLLSSSSNVFAISYA